MSWQATKTWKASKDPHEACTRPGAHHDGQMQLGRPASPRPAQRVVGRLGLADTAWRFFLQLLLVEARQGLDPVGPVAGSYARASVSSTSQTFAERDDSNIVHRSRFEKGGHFASHEVPEVVVGDIQAFFAAPH
ncbi:hypothetical protein ACQPXB_22190 [Amycolatopsis sp. CA-161197]|uniref:hypothetical protein n=1 Tax=unclassified Amycolatopsis TaxID=2618356 RepID=UPI0036BA40DC